MLGFKSLLRPNPYRRRRGHAHDPQSPARRSQRQRLVCSGPVLLAGFLIAVNLAAKISFLALLRQNLTDPFTAETGRRAAEEAAPARAAVVAVAAAVVVAAAAAGRSAACTARPLAA